VFFRAQTKKGKPLEIVPGVHFLKAFLLIHKTPCDRDLDYQ